MKLDEQEIQWIKVYGGRMKEILNKQLKQMKQDVFRMPRGEERDIQILFINKLEEWISGIDNSINSKDTKIKSFV